MALIKSRSGIFVPFISGYCSAVPLVRALTVLPTPRMSDFVARFVGINVFYSQAARARTFHRRIFTRGRFNLISPTTAANAYVYPPLSYATITQYVYVYVSKREHKSNVDECALQRQKNRKSGRVYRLVKKRVIRDLSSKTLLNTFLVDMLCATQRV